MNAWLRALVLALLGLCGTAPAAFAGHDWRTFEDGYQNLSGCYPADVFAMQPPALGAPEHFTSGDGAWATVSAQVNNSGLGPRAAMRAAELDQFGARARPAYESVRPGEFVFSGYGRGQILYEKTILDGGLLKTLVVGYPNAKRAFYNNVARKMTACFVASG